MTRAGPATALSLALLAAPGAALAHGRSASWSTWEVRGAEVDVRVRVARLDLSARPRFAALAAAALAPAADDERALAEYLERRVRVGTDAGTCPVEPASFQVLDGGDGFVARAWRVRCDASARLRIRVELFEEEIPTHVHFASLVRGGAPVAERLLTEASRTWEVGRGVRARSAAVREFVALGARHVASGLDHLAFMLALMVAARSLRALAGVVTGFTLGHSATLALAVLGGVRPDVATVEALVGASIAVVAVENAWIERRDPWLSRALVGGLAAVGGVSLWRGRDASLALLGLVIFVACYFGLLARSGRAAEHRWTVAALFGAVHGFAFSGVLSEMPIARGALARALLGFNLGVELAQLALIALFWPLWRLVARSDARPQATEVTSATALCAGAYWLVERTFG